MTDYALGFYFDKSRHEVYLIEKLKPAWQKGKYNGIGGHIEPGETPHDAMVREMKEETGIDVPKWRHFATVYDMEAKIFVFEAASTDVSYGLPFIKECPTAEKVVPCMVHSILLHGLTYRYPVIDNLPWLIAMSLDPNIKGPQEVTYTYP